MAARPHDTIIITLGPSQPSEVSLIVPPPQARFTRPPLRPNSPPLVAFLRRLIMGSAFFCAAILAILLFPLWVPLAMLFDRVHERGRAHVYAMTRAGLFVLVFLWSDLIGFAGGILVTPLLLTAGGRARWLAWNHALAWDWADRMFRWTLRIFSMKLTVEGEEVLAEGGPFLFFVRHASGGDVVVPLAFAGERNGLGVRIVLKRELLFDPGIDLVCSRLPCAFVRRGTGDPAAEIEQICTLAEGMGRDECLVIFPEGTRFGAHKRARLIERLRQKGDALALERAERLRRVLPPRPGGPLALLERNPHLDVVFCAHVGYEGAADWGEIWRGELAHKPLTIRFWRVRASEIPREHAAADAWLYDQWAKMDRWIQSQG